MKRLRHQGFTLLEVLLVVLLMGIAATAVTLTMGGGGQDSDLKQAAQQFMRSVELVLDETVLSGDFMGIVVEPDHYQFVLFKDGKWSPLEGDRLLTKREMEPGIELSLILEGLPLAQEDEEDNDPWIEDKPLIEKSDAEKRRHPDPQIFIFPSGEISAFELTFSGHDDQGKLLTQVVVADPFGRLSLKQDRDEKHNAH